MLGLDNDVPPAAAVAAVAGQFDDLPDDDDDIAGRFAAQQLTEEATPPPPPQERRGMGAITVRACGKVDDVLVAAFARLTPQLSRTAPAPDAAALRGVVAHESCAILVARDEGGAIVGVATLVAFPIPTGARAWVEDVVVDESARGRGVGAALLAAAVARARAGGCRTVDLTSRPSREAANRLYARAGFEKRDTNVYRLTLGAPA